MNNYERLNQARHDYLWRKTKAKALAVQQQKKKEAAIARGIRRRARREARQKERSQLYADGRLMKEILGEDYDPELNPRPWE